MVHQRLIGEGESGCFDPQSTATRDQIEVVVGMQERHAGPDGDGSDQAVGQPPNRDALGATCPVQGGRVLEVDDALNRQEVAAVQKPPELLDVAGVSAPRQDLHHDDVGGCQRCAAGEVSPHAVVNSAARRAEELDPGGRVDEDLSAADA